LISGETHIRGFNLISNLTSLVLILGLVVEVRTGHFLHKEYFKTFSVDHLSLITKRISLFYKRYFLWTLIIILPMILLFVDGPAISYRILIYLFSALQNLFSVYLFITLYDFLLLKGLEKHTTILPAVLAILLTYARNSHNEEVLFYNPFGGVINLPILVPNPLSYLVPVILFLLLFMCNKYYVHNNWAKH